jgi:hypothetical protein
LPFFFEKERVREKGSKKEEKKRQVVPQKNTRTHPVTLKKVVFLGLYHCQWAK